jgi:hypothetical protein
MVSAMTAPDGLDELRAKQIAPRTPAELIEGGTSCTIERRVNDGTRHRAVQRAARAGRPGAPPRAPGLAYRRHAGVGPFFWRAGSGRE